MQTRPFTRRGGVTVISVVGLALAIAGTALAAASVPARTAAAPITPVTAAAATTAPVTPRHGAPFIPTQGDWEGTVDGFAASFQLTYDAAMRQPAGVPHYGIRNLVMLRPSSCPASAAHYTESIVSGRVPVALGRYGSLNLGRFDLAGSLTGPRRATLAGSYAPGGCHGRLTWHMHPATRSTVEDGAWTVHFADGESDRFAVEAGGRLATGIGLPRAVATCNGLEGTFDAFIGAGGGAAVSQGGIRLTLRFAGGRATGRLTARGCNRAIGLSATHAGG